MRTAIGLVLCFFLAGLSPLASASSTSDEEWPGEPVDNHLHMTWAALTMEVNEWAVHHVGGYSHFFEYLIEVAGLRIHLKHSQAHSKCAEE